MDHLDDLSMGACFIAGTLILTDDGKEEIEDIQVGDYVYVRDQYGEAEELEVGDLAENADGESVPIESVDVEYLKEPITVYNFEVADYHTYYVGDTKVLVHNTCTVDGEINGVGNSLITNTGQKLDTTPSKNHTTVNTNPGLNGEPNSSIDILGKDGSLVTRRWFDNNGDQIRDVDMTNHAHGARK